MAQPEISVVIPTYNRCELLRRCLISVLQQDANAITFEIIVVDNNSSDGTAAVLDSLIATAAGKLRYISETRQGNAYARNTGIEHAQGAIIAFVDDDVYVESNWLRTIKVTFAERPEIAFIGGKVLPAWEGRHPTWLTQDHWAPIAAVDYGPDKLFTDQQAPIGLLTANIAFRRAVFADVGSFSPALQRVKNGIGSMEDHEFLSRVYRSGKRGMYVPALIATTLVTSERMTKKYHRRWHMGHGRFYAIMADPEWERSKLRLLGVPAHLYRQTALDALGWLKSVLRGRRDRAFLHEQQLRFFCGFFLQRVSKLLRLVQHGASSTPRESQNPLVETK